MEPSSNPDSVLIWEDESLSRGWVMAAGTRVCTVTLSCTLHTAEGLERWPSSSEHFLPDMRTGGSIPAPL